MILRSVVQKTDLPCKGGLFDLVDDVGLADVIVDDQLRLHKMRRLLAAVDLEAVRAGIAVVALRKAHPHLRHTAPIQVLEISRAELFGNPAISRQRTVQAPGGFPGGQGLEVLRLQHRIVGEGSLAHIHQQVAKTGEGRSRATIPRGLEPQDDPGEILGLGQPGSAEIEGEDANALLFLSRVADGDRAAGVTLRTADTARRRGFEYPAVFAGGRNDVLPDKRLWIFIGADIALIPLRTCEPIIGSQRTDVIIPGIDGLGDAAERNSIDIVWIYYEVRVVADEIAIPIIIDEPTGCIGICDQVVVTRKPCAG